MYTLEEIQQIRLKEIEKSGAETRHKNTRKYQALHYLKEQEVTGQTAVKSFFHVLFGSLLCRIHVYVHIYLDFLIDL